MRLIDSQPALDAELEGGAVSSEPLEALAARVAEILASRDDGRALPEAWLDAGAAARYLGYSETGTGRRRGRQRIYDLVSQRRLRFAKDGSRLLFRRAWLDNYLEGAANDGGMDGGSET
jgi:excisionase family DNA binding protein